MEILLVFTDYQCVEGKLDIIGQKCRIALVQYVVVKMR